jgi:peptidoglycan/LPS O-acetylase OafA/YrhL
MIAVLVSEEKMAAPQPAPGSLDLSRRIPELDGIRGIAIGMVIFYHYFTFPATARVGSFLWYLLLPGRLGWSGVDLFFVLSGFLIGGILLDERRASNYFKVFYTRRFFRIVPIYMVFLGCYFAVAAASRAAKLSGLSWMTDAQLPWYCYVLFLQNFWMTVGNTFGPPPLGILWSLAVEEQFYLTLPWLVRFLNPKRLTQVVIEGLLLAPILRIAAYALWPKYTNAWFVLMPCRADALLFGVLAAITLRDASWRGKLESNRILLRFLLVVLAIGIPLLTQMYYIPYGFPTVSLGFTWIAVFYVLVLVYALTQREGWIARCLRWRWLRWLGTIAYGAYLFHQLILESAFGLIWGHGPIFEKTPNVLLTLIALAGTLLLCRLSWNYFEKPLIQFGHREDYLR